MLEGVVAIGAVGGRLLSLAPWLAPAVGLMGVGACVAWELAAATLAADLDAICYAETRSGFVLDREMGRLSAWVLAHLRTPEGAAAFRALRDEPLEERAADLATRAHAASLRACPLVASYDTLAAESRYRADVQQACSRFTFPGMTDLPPSERVQRLAEWLDARASCPRSRALAVAIREEPRIDDAQQWMRNASREAGSFSCDIAATLGAPPPPLACAPRAQ
jgi:hypothetical protein